MRPRVITETVQRHGHDGMRERTTLVQNHECARQLARNGESGRRIKVLLLTVGLTIGGTEGQILELASRMDRRRFDVSVCALKGEGPLAQDLRARGVRVIALDGRGTRDILVLYRLLRTISREAPDVVHSFLFMANLASRLAACLLRIPVLLASYRDREIWKSRGAQFLDRLTIGRVDAVTCCSDAVRHFVMARLGRGRDKFVTIYNGVDMARFGAPQTVTRSDVRLRDGLPVIGVVCRLIEPKKGLTVLLDALARLAAPTGIPPCQLLIVGEGPSELLIRRHAERLGLSVWVVFTGLRRDVPQMLGLMDIFVMASRYEGFGIAIIEAMAAARPVVASAAGGIPEIVVPGETGLLVPPGDPEALAVAIGQLLRQPDRAALFGRQGQQRARALFSIDTMVTRHEELYESLIAGRL
ncbi:MAG: glycosyltransferase [Nitrospiraceae bacterium]